MSEIYSIFRIWREQGGRCRVEYETNDDDDDGYPDAEVARATYHCKSLKQALELTGKSRIGVYGHSVDVYLDGEKIGPDDMPEQEPTVRVVTMDEEGAKGKDMTVGELHKTVKDILGEK